MQVKELENFYSPLDIHDSVALTAEEGGDGAQCMDVNVVKEEFRRCP